MSATMTHMLGNIGNGMTGIPTGVAVGINGSLNSINGMGGLNSLTNMGNMRSDDCDDDGEISLQFLVYFSSNVISFLSLWFLVTRPRRR